MHASRFYPTAPGLTALRRTTTQRFAALALALLCAAGMARADGAVEEKQWLPRHPDTELRVLAWNVARNFFHDNDAFQRVLRAVDADLLILDEMPEGVSADMIADGLPEGDTPWQAVYGSGGGPHQRASIAARVPLQRIPGFDRLAYPRARIEDWLQSVPAQAQPHVRASLEAGVAAVAAVVEIEDRRLLVVGLDLQCCGDSADSPQEQRRRFESRAIRGAIDAVADSLKVDAVLVGGDFNTVQGDAPVTLMQRGASVPISLREADARHRGDGAADWTWDGRGTPFPSRQLDYLLHSDRLRVVQAQIFDSEDLAPEQQKALHLDSELSRSLSEHRPVVVDFAWRMEPTP
jgi:endonuclease/exonuclease/phosphatase (EEP) superfamily protein YafD